MNSKRLLAVFVAAALIVSVFAGAGAADYGSSPSVDTSGTDDTSTVSELQPGDTLANFSGNASKNTTVQWIAADNSTAVELYRNGSNHTAYRNVTPSTAVWNSTDSDGHFNATFAHNELLDTEHAPGENVTMDLRTINNTSNSTIVDTINTVYIDWDNATATETLNDSDTGASGLAVPTNETGLLALDKDHTTVTLSGQNAPADTFHIAAANATVADDLSAADTNADRNGELSSAFAPGPNAFVKVSSSDTTVFAPVYASESDVPSEVTDNNRTYAVVQSVGGTTGMSIRLGDEFSASDTLDIEMVAGTGTLSMNIDYIQASVSNWVSMSMTGGVMAAIVPAFGLVAVPRRRRLYPSGASAVVDETAPEPCEPAVPSTPDAPTTQGADGATTAPRDRGAG